jgi:AcrR family transcriptional regulator
MTDQVRRRRGREATTAAILDAAEQLFSTHGYDGVTVRDVAARASVSHALVHQFAGSKTDLFRAVLSRNEGFLVSGAPDRSDLLESASRILNQGLEQHGRDHARLLIGSALSGLPCERTPGRFAAVDRLIELARRQAESAPAAERAEKDLDPRLVVACVGSLYLGWVAGEPWMRRAAGLEEMDDAELVDGLERVILGTLKDHVPGMASGTAAGVTRAGGP